LERLSISRYHSLLFSRRKWKDFELFASWRLEWRRRRSRRRTFASCP
jgi:hypothetical protein